MATTWIKPLHVNKGKTIAQTISERNDYAKNPDKTEQGVLVAGYACDPRTADEQFLLDKLEYERNTGRDQGSRNILAYHVRQSFKPGEITPEKAQEVGYELAMRWTKGKHAFIVAVHTDREHLHCHIVFNSTKLDCLGKYKNPWNSSFALRRLSDIICTEHGLSVIKNPKDKGQSYAEWLGNEKKTPYSTTIKNKIDELIPSCSTFDELTLKLRQAGFSVNTNRKNISISAPGQKRPTRLNSLDDDYTEAALCRRISKREPVKTIAYSGSQTKVSLLIDIQAKIREGKGPGYEQWSKIFNLKQAAKTLIFLQENGIDSYDDLKKKSSSASGEFSVLTTKIKEIESRLKEISELQKHIGQYGKTREIYAGYKASGWSRDYYDKHATAIILNRAAKKHFDSLGTKKLPTMKSLKQEYATLAAEKKKLYSGYHKLKQNSRDLSTAKHNADLILGLAQNTQIQENVHNRKRENSHGI